jgi:hypothetical protein
MLRTVYKPCHYVLRRHAFDESPLLAVSIMLRKH